MERKNTGQLSLACTGNLRDNRQPRRLGSVLPSSNAIKCLYYSKDKITYLMLHLRYQPPLKLPFFPYLRFQRFQIDMLESFLEKKKSEENIISVERYRG